MSSPIMALSSALSNRILSPSGTLLTVAQLGSVGAWMRGVIKNSSEKIGFPQATPDNRKGDYSFRDVYMPWWGVYTGELSYRAADQFYTTPNTLRLLKLNQLRSLYTPDSFHTPGFAKTTGTQNLKRLPQSLIDRMHGSSHDPRTYYLIPDLLEQDHLPDLEARLKKAKKPKIKAQLRAEIEETRLLAHHMRRMFNHDQYLDHYLVKEARVLQAADASVVKETLKEMETVAKLVAEAQEYQKTHKRSLVSGNKKLKELQRELKKLERYSDVKTRHGFYRDLFGLTDQQLMDTIRGPSPLRDIRELGLRKAINRLFHPKYTSERAYHHAKDELLKPILQSQLASRGIQGSQAGLIEKVVMDLAEHKVTGKTMSRMFKSAEFYIKMPLGVLSIFVLYGILANIFDARFLQPFQREVVKKRGHAKDFTLPIYTGILPGAAVFFGLYKLPGIKHLGHMGSFAVAGAAALVAYFASSAALFYALMARGTAQQKKQHAAAVKARSFQQPVTALSPSGTNPFHVPRP